MWDTFEATAISTGKKKQSSEGKEASLWMAHPIQSIHVQSSANLPSTRVVREEFNGGN
jgi:hypothetical protein